MKAFRQILAVCAFLMPLGAQAQAPRLAEIIDTQIRSGWQTSSGTHIAALNMRLAQDWMTYWRHPGESGLVPRLDWSGSQNVAQARILWPEPRLYMKAGFASIGYSREVLLPIEVTPAQPGQPVKLDATLSVGVCNDICIPVDLSLQMDIKGTGRPDRAIATAMESRPRAARNAGLSAVSCTITPEKKGVRLSASLDLPSSGAQEFLLIEMPGVVVRSLPSQRTGDTLVGHGLIRSSAAQGINRSDIRFSIVSERGTLVHQGCAISD